MGRVRRDDPVIVGSPTTANERDALFRLLVESVSQYAILMLDPAGYVASWNVGARRIKGYTAGEIIGQHFSVFYPSEGVEVGKPQRMLEVAAAEGRAQDEGWRIRKGGSRFWAGVTMTALRSVEGELLGFAKVTHDLTERRQAEEERIRLLEETRSAREEAARAEAATQARDEFLSVAAHELRTPVTSLRIAAQMLIQRLNQRSVTDPKQLQRALSSIDRQSERLSRLVTQLLDTVRIQAGRIQLQKAETNLAELVRSAIEQAQLRTTEHELALSAPESIWASIDAIRFEQVIMNLLDNAIKFSPSGGPVEVELAPPTPGCIRLAVRDHGVGVAPEKRSRLFERFYQAQEEHTAGMGLGLYVSHEIVTLHGGSIVAEFPPDGGTRIVIEIPAA